MRLLARALLLTALVAPVGCTESKNDNSAIQTPDDQPIGPPQAFNPLNARGGQPDGKTPARGAGGKLPAIDIKTDP